MVSSSDFISNDFKAYCRNHDITIKPYSQYNVSGLTETNETTRSLHGMLSILDRLCRTIRNMAYNMGVAKQEIDPGIMKVLLNIYNSSPHTAFYNILHKRISPNEMDNNNDLEDDELYNLTNWFKATQYLLKHCLSRTLRDIYYKYDTIIYEGGQGLLLSQKNVGDFPHLTPSSTGATNIAKEISGLNCETDIYYVSRSYMTRHGNGPMEYECAKDDINSTIVDKTNQANEWQGSLRFGFLNQEKLLERVKNDFATYHEGVRAHMVYTQLNYTDNKLCVGKNKLEEIEKPNFISSVYGSNKEDEMFKALQHDEECSRSQL